MAAKQAELEQQTQRAKLEMAAKQAELEQQAKANKALMERERFHHPDDFASSIPGVVVKPSQWCMGTRRGSAWTSWGKILPTRWGGCTGRWAGLWCRWTAFRPSRSTRSPGAAGRTRRPSR